MKNYLFIFSLLLLCSFASAQDWVQTDYQKTFIGKIQDINTERITILDTASKILFDVNLKSVKKYKYQGNVYAPNAKLLPEARRKESNVEKSIKVESNTNTAGDELKIAANTYYAGFALETIGATVILVGNYLNKDADGDKQAELDRKQKSRKTTTIIGGAISFVGFITNLTAFYHIGIAGDKLNLGTSNDGLTLSLKF